MAPSVKRASGGKGRRAACPAKHISGCKSRLDRRKRVGAGSEDKAGKAQANQQVLQDLHVRRFLALAREAGGKGPAKTEPRAAGSWSRGVRSEFEASGYYFGFSFSAAELMQ
jgi:hypothetical protein